MIKTFDFYALRLNETYEFTNRLVKVLELRDLEALGLQVVVAPLKTAFGKLEEGLKKGNTKIETLTVKDADKGRDGHLRAMEHYCKAYSYNEDEAKRYAANVLLNAIESYGEIVKESYDAQSAKMNNLLSDFESQSKLIDAANVITAGPFVSQLKQSQLNFEASVAERLDYKSSMSDVNNQQAVKEIKSALDTVLQYVEVMQKVSPNTDFQQLVKDVNLLITETMAPVLIRQGRNAANEES